MTNNNNNNYSWTKDFSTAVLLWEQGIAPGPPAGTTLGGAGGGQRDPSPAPLHPHLLHHPRGPQCSVWLWGGRRGGWRRGEASLPCAWQGGRGGTGLPPLPPPTPEVRAGSQAHTDPDGCHGGGGSTSVPTDTTHSHAQTDSSTGTRPSWGALRAPGRVGASSSGRAQGGLAALGFVVVVVVVVVFVYFFTHMSALKAADFQASKQQASSRIRPHPPMGRELPIPVPIPVPCPHPRPPARSLPLASAPRAVLPGFQLYSSF